MSEDKQLLELAAKAAGYGEVWYVDGSDTAYVGPKYVFGEPIRYKIFNPLTDDGDALRLAVKLDMNIFSGYKKMIAEIPSDGDMPSIQESEIKGENPQAATRRAIVRAAAEIGRGMG